MKIYILTHGRRHRQTTFDNLPRKWQEHVTFVIQTSEAHKWEDSGQHLHFLPPEVTNLHQTRQYLLEREYIDQWVEMDDDVVFSRRRTDDPTKFRPMEDEDFDHMFAEMENKLAEGYPLVGISPREGANRNTEPFLYCTRQTRIHGVNREAINKFGGRWDMLRSPGPEDFCMLLQAFTSGEENCVLNNYCHNQGGSNTSGGCSTYRTMAVHNDACQHLAELFPQFVTVVQKHSDDPNDEWGNRQDVRVQWKKALKHGRS